MTCNKHYIFHCLFKIQPRGLRRGSTAASWLGLWVRILPWHGCLCGVSIVCCQVDVSASGRSLVQRSPTARGVSECDREATHDKAMTRNQIEAPQYIHLFHKCILARNSTCFGLFLCPSLGVYLLYTQQWYMSYSFRAGPG